MWFLLLCGVVINVYGMENKFERDLGNFDGWLKRIVKIYKNSGYPCYQTAYGTVAQELSGLFLRKVRSYRKNPLLQWTLYNPFMKAVNELYNVYDNSHKARFSADIAEIARQAYQEVELSDSHDPGEPLDVGSHQIPLTKAQESRIIRGNFAASSYYFATQALQYPAFSENQQSVTRCILLSAHCELETLGHKRYCKQLKLMKK